MRGSKQKWLALHAVIWNEFGFRLGTQARSTTRISVWWQTISLMSSSHFEIDPRGK